MPLVRVEVRNEYGLGLHELYGDANREDPKAVLDGVAVAGLVVILRQLGDLAEYVFLFLFAWFLDVFWKWFSWFEKQKNRFLFNVVAFASGSWKCTSRILIFSFEELSMCFRRVIFLIWEGKLVLFLLLEAGKVLLECCFFSPLFPFPFPFLCGLVIFSSECWVHWRRCVNLLEFVTRREVSKTRRGKTKAIMIRILEMPFLLLKLEFAVILALKSKKSVFKVLNKQVL